MIFYSSSSTSFLFNGEIDQEGCLWCEKNIDGWYNSIILGDIIWKK